MSALRDKLPNVQENLIRADSFVNSDGKAPMWPNKGPEKTLKDFRDYIIKEEPKEEKAIISIGDVPVLSEGNILQIRGKMKSRKTRLATILINQCKLKTAYVDTEQGRRHSYRLSISIPTADVFHLRGQAPKEIMRVIEECVSSGGYELLVIDNVRDLLRDFNNVEQSGEIELFLKRISESVPVIAIIHANKNNGEGQGHVAYSMDKIAQTSISVQLVNAEDPAQGSFVDCASSRDEPFKRAFISVDGELSTDSHVKAGGRGISRDELRRRLGDTEYTRDELLEKLGEIYGIKPDSAKNSLSEIRKAWPGMIADKPKGKSKVYYVNFDCIL